MSCIRRSGDPGVGRSGISAVELIHWWVWTQGGHQSAIASSKVCFGEFTGKFGGENEFGGNSQGVSVAP